MPVFQEAQDCQRTFLLHIENTQQNLPQKRQKKKISLKKQPDE